MRFSVLSMIANARLVWQQYAIPIDAKQPGLWQILTCFTKNAHWPICAIIPYAGFSHRWSHNMYLTLYYYMLDEVPLMIHSCNFHEPCNELCSVHGKIAWMISHCSCNFCELPAGGGLNLWGTWLHQVLPGRDERSSWFCQAVPREKAEAETTC